MTIGFVTDSTAYLPAELIAQFEIEIIPVHVVVDSVSYNDLGEISTNEVCKQLLAGRSVTTSRPSVQEFISVYQNMQAKGHKEIISVHVSSKLSGTYESALLAARQVTIPVRVVDSSAIAMMMGFPLLSAIALANEGVDIDDVEDYLRLRLEQSSLILAVESTKYLEQGGRVSPLQNRVASKFNIKPLLEVRNGQIGLREIVRSTRNANFKLISIAQSSSAMAENIAVHHVDAPERGHFIAEQLRLRLGRPEIPLVPIGPVVGAHVGPGAVAIAMMF